ncbi:MAG: VOC family protein [Candidatus Hydrogenedentes bacterium]|nr:VOC family protein [Candidatus Hydrogenedentota bacterium]
MNRVTHFEIAAANPEKAAQFYREVFGWNVAGWPGDDEYWTLTTGPETEEGIDGGVYGKKNDAQQPVTVSVSVNSIDDYVARVIARGGRVVVPKREISGVGWLAYCCDCDGVVFCLHQENLVAE